MKKAFQKDVLKYTVVFEPAEEGGYVVHVPALPGCATQGDTFEEAYRNAQDAMQGYLHVAREMNEEIPVERDGTVIARVPASP